MPKKINIKGRITSDGNSWIYDWLKIPYSSPQNVIKALEDANGEDVEIYINSGGGSVYDGYEIYNAISEYKGNVVIKIMGLAASAASFIAMAPNAKCYMSPLSEMMIHNSSTYVGGPHQVMDETSNMLKVTDSTIAQAYILKSGIEESKVRNLMEQETWFTANHAKELGLIDGILFDEKPQNVNPIPTLYNAMPINDDSLISQLEQCKTVDELKAKINENIENIFKQSTMSQPTKINKVVDNKEKGGVSMNTQELQQKHPDLYNQIVADARQEGATNERNRINAINALSVPGNDETIKNVIKDGIENGLEAGTVAINIINAQKQVGENYLANVKKDAADSGIDKVKNEGSQQVDKSKEVDNKQTGISILVNAAKELTGGVR